MTYTPYNPTRSSNFQGGPAMPYGVDPALQARTQSQTGQWHYYVGGIGALGQNWGGNLSPAANTPWVN